MRAEDRTQQQRRSLGCAIWAVILVILFYMVIFIIDSIYSWQRGVNAADIQEWITSNYIPLLITLIIATPVAAIIGKVTKMPASKKTVLFLAALISVLGFIGIESLSVKLCELGTGPQCIPLSEAPVTFLCTIAGGILFGLVAGYGYWKAGRDSGSSK